MIEKTAARRHRRNRSLDDEAPLDRANVDIHQCHEIEGTGGGRRSYRQFVATRPR
jgi:hypothetical protein